MSMAEREGPIILRGAAMLAAKLADHKLCSFGARVLVLSLVFRKQEGG